MTKNYQIPFSMYDGCSVSVLSQKELGKYPNIIEDKHSRGAA